MSHFLNFKSWIKLIYDTVDICNFVINEFNPTFEVQNMGNEAFQNASFGNSSFPNKALSYSCLWVEFSKMKEIENVVHKKVSPALQIENAQLSSASHFFPLQNIKVSFEHYDFYTKNHFNSEYPS